MEQVNQSSLERHDLAFFRGGETIWEEYLPHLEFAYSTSKHSSTWFSPFMLLNCCTLERMIPIFYILFARYARTYCTLCIIIYVKLRLCLHICWLSNKESFFWGDEKVFLKVPSQLETLTTRKCQNFSPRFCGPCTILEKTGNVAYKLQSIESSRGYLVFHVNRPKKVVGKMDDVVGPIALVELIETKYVLHEPA